LVDQFDYGIIGTAAYTREGEGILGSGFVKVSEIAEPGYDAAQFLGN
jgi:hypothetical protein